MRDYPMPMPFGWFQVAWSDEIPAGGAKPMFFFDRHLVGWRGGDGTPTSGMRSALTSAPTSACGPRSRATRSCAHSTGGATTVMAPASTSRIRIASTSRPSCAPTRSSSATAWCSPGTTRPMSLPGGTCRSSSNSERIRGSRRCSAASTHSDATGRRSRRPRSTPPTSRPTSSSTRPRPTAARCRRMPRCRRSTRTRPTARSPGSASHRTSRPRMARVEGRIDTDVVGPGFAATWFTGLVDTLLLGCATPTGPGSCELRYSFVVRHTGDDDVDIRARRGVHPGDPRAHRRGRRGVGVQGVRDETGARPRRRADHAVPPVVRAVLRRGRRPFTGSVDTQSHRSARVITLSPRTATTSPRAPSRGMHTMRRDDDRWPSVQ